MNVHSYTTKGGKDLILEYIKNLSKKESATGLKLIQMLQEEGISALDNMNTRQLKRKLWEIKFSQNRIMYVLVDDENIYLLNACKKEKGKAEKFEIDKTIARVKELEILIEKNLI